MEEHNFNTVHYPGVKVFIMNIFITTYIYEYESHFPRAMLHFSIIKVDLAALATSARFSPRTSIWHELTDEKLFSPNNPFVILYTKPMLQITGYIIQTTYLRWIANPTMFSPDHITKIKFLFISLDSSDSSV